MSFGGLTGGFSIVTSFPTYSIFIDLRLWSAMHMHEKTTITVVVRVPIESVVILRKSIRLVLLMCNSFSISSDKSLMWFFSSGVSCKTVGMASKGIVSKFLYVCLVFDFYRSIIEFNNVCPICHLRRSVYIYYTIKIV